MHFKNNEFTSAWKCIETVSDFESNRSFLFLWGYSIYMVFAFIRFHGKAVQEQQLLEFHRRQQDNLFEPYPTLSLTAVSVIVDRLQPYVKDGCSDAFLLFLYGLCVKESDKHQALRCFTTSVRECISVIRITCRFPLFWGAWEELLSIVTTRSTLLYVLNNTHDSIIRDFFWIALSNRMNEVGMEACLHTRRACRRAFWTACSASRQRGGSASTSWAHYCTTREVAKRRLSDG